MSAKAVRRDWKNAVAAANKDWFALDSSRQTPQLLSELGFRPDETVLALAIVQAEIHRLSPPFVPRQVLLFSGHMVDTPGRPKPRFPPAMVPAATAQIERALDELAHGGTEVLVLGTVDVAGHGNSSGADRMHASV